LLLHGLESSAEQFYIKHTADYLSKRNYDLVAINYRGCSGEPNNLYKGYHSGCSPDLAAVITHINRTTQYDELYIVGFSLGGNILLKYLAEYQSQVPNNFIKGVAFSTPVDLKGTSLQLSSTFAGIYQKHFLRKLNKKLAQKTIDFPKKISMADIRKLDSLTKFDDFYTAPVNGFKNAFDYYEKCSCKPLLNEVKHPVLIVNALDDPFLPESCYPFDVLSKHKFIDFETPKTGGHLGFIKSFKNQTCWYPERIWEFINK
jgi:predicted alpha/beta-fold hydrolase